METLLRAFQVLLAIGLIAVVLLQRSEGGGLGIGSSGGMGSFMSVRGTANFLTRMTSILGGLFMLTCLGLALIAHPAQTARSIFDTPGSTPTMPAPPASQAPPATQGPLPISAPGEKPAETGAAPAAAAPAATTAPTAAETTVPAPVVVPPVVATPTTEIPAPAPAKPTAKAPEHKTKKPAHKTAAQPSGQ